MWANLHLLFWLSLIPFATAWLGNNFGAEWPTAFFASILFLCAAAYTILVRAILARQGRDSALAEAIGSDIKGNVSLIAYALAIGSAFFAPWLSYALIIAVAVMWFIPDSRLKMFV